MPNTQFHDKKSQYIYRNAHHPANNLDELKLICKIFSHLERLVCNVSQSKHISFLLYRLINLQHIHVQTALEIIPSNDHRIVRILESEVTIWTVNTN